MKDLSRKVSLLCSVCGNDLFETLDDVEGELCDAPDDTRMKCSDCGKIYTKAELLAENQELIDSNIDDIQQEAIREIEKELKKAFRR